MNTITPTQETPGFNILKSIVSKNLGIPEENLKPETKLKEDLNLTGTDFIEFILLLEHEYNVIIPDDAAQHLTTLEDIHQHLFKTQK